MSHHATHFYTLCILARSLEELLALPPSRRKPGHIARMLHFAQQEPLCHLFQRLSPLTRAAIMERATLGTYTTGHIMCSQGEAPQQWLVVLSGNMTLFHRAEHEHAVEIGAVWVEDYSSGSDDDNATPAATQQATQPTPARRRVPGAGVRKAARLAGKHDAEQRWGAVSRHITGGDSFAAEEILSGRRCRYTVVAGVGHECVDTVSGARSDAVQDRMAQR